MGGPKGLQEKNSSQGGGPIKKGGGEKRYPPGERETTPSRPEGDIPPEGYEGRVQ